MSLHSVEGEYRKLQRRQPEQNSKRLNPSPEHHFPALLPFGEKNAMSDLTPGCRIHPKSPIEGVEVEFGRNITQFFVI
jgi:hypothetical protein